DPGARGYAGLAARVAASGAEAVFLGGLLDTNAAQLVRDLRRALPADVDLLGPDGLTPLPLLVERAGSAARGVFVSLPGLVTEELPPRGEAFVRRFAGTRAGDEIEPSAVYAAQAADVVLDAIGRSDGSRASVLAELFRTRVRGGILGDFGFDARGDITESPITVLRVARAGTSRRTASVEGGDVVRVSRPRAALVGDE
ncbi:MAG: ABC transporter substrate-binding protein, partial [Solirubrobacterales bacterium]|nr:ABC transporter substrate-binding protein [Solirubrobacterales bacterium]